METQQCRQCKEVFPATAEYFQQSRPNKPGIRRWCIACYKEKKRIEAAQRRLDNPDKHKAASKRYYKNNATHLCQSAADKRKENPTKQREANKRFYYSHTEQLREQRRSDPANMRATTIRYRARKRGLACEYTTSDWRWALAHFDNRCAVCGRTIVLWHTLAQDHWIPLSASNCPGTVPTNIIPLCHGVDGCNNSKSNTDPVEWLIERFGQRKAKQILKRIEDYFASLH